MVAPSCRHILLTKASHNTHCTSAPATTTIRAFLSTSSPSSSKKDTSSSKSGVLAHVEGLFNHVSGTSEIQSLKQKVQEVSYEFDKATDDLVSARKLVETCLQEWQYVSGQHLTLLQRKESWTPDDAQAFTSIITREVKTKNALKDAQNALSKAETAATQSQIRYMNSLRQRYQEEQSWQDQWRVLGTYGTWSLIGLNSMIFLASQYYQNKRESERLEQIERIIVGNKNNENENSNKNDDDGIRRGETLSLAKEARQRNETNDASSRVEGRPEKQSGKKFLWLARLWRPNNKSVANKDEANGKGSGDITTTSAPEDNDSEETEKPWIVRFWSKAVSSSKQLLLKNRQSLLTWQSTDNPTKDLINTVKEVHIPSAIFGASVMGVIALAMSVALPSSRRGGG